MIEVIGSAGTAEYDAAQQLAAAFSRLWPGVESSPRELDYIKIAAGVKLSGYKVSDIDIVIAARFAKERYIVPKAVFLDSDGKKVVGTKVAVRSFVAAVEVKDHDSARVMLDAGSVSVRYKDGWKSATDQNEMQRYALLEYLSDRTHDRPWVYRCIMLRGLPSLPRQQGRQVPESGAVASDFDGTSFLMAMATVNAMKKQGGQYSIWSGNSGLLDSVLASPVFTPVVPSRLDRVRMDRIAARPVLARELGAMLGESRVHLRGKGGAGKTVLLLQAAKEAFEQEGKRSLILTYNHALAADIQRLLALMGVPAIGDAGGIDVRTVMSFTYSWLSALGLLKEGEDPQYEDYERRCREAHRYVAEGLITAEELQAAREAVGGQFGYDAVIVDEAQDWPQAEADLVCALYGGEAVSIADGVDQLVRGSETDWKRSVGGKKAAGFRSLNECLRMKANLAAFANAVAIRAGLSWSVSPSTEAAGGRVILASGDYANLADLRRDLVAGAKAAGNSEIDFLHCVPPSGVCVEGNHRVSKLSKVFQEEGREAWDGVDAVLRRDYPRAVSQLRVVQYESCRGLEGWVTVLDGIDEFWARKYEEGLHSPLDLGDRSASISPHAQASAVAWRWVMIALTRPIDTLVLTIRDSQSEAGRAFGSVAQELKDFVEVC